MNETNNVIEQAENNIPNTNEEQNISDTENAIDYESVKESVAEEPRENNDLSAHTAEDIRALKQELETLKTELKNSRAAYDRLSAECADFSELYPEVSVTNLPDSVWKSFKSGVPLAAAYALYEKRERSAAAKAHNINQKNKELSTGSLDSSGSEEFFSPAEVRAMSAAEVRANYAKIIVSMSKWH